MLIIVAIVVMLMLLALLALLYTNGSSDGRFAAGIAFFAGAIMLGFSSFLTFGEANATINPGQLTTVLALGVFLSGMGLEFLAETKPKDQ